MYNVSIIGASGYTGAQLVQLVIQHPKLVLAGTYVSENSSDAGKNIAELHGNLAHVNSTLTPISDAALEEMADGVDFIFLYLRHRLLRQQILRQWFLLFWPFYSTHAYREHVTPFYRYFYQ